MLTSSSEGAIQHHTLNAAQASWADRMFFKHAFLCLSLLTLVCAIPFPEPQKPETGLQVAQSDEDSVFNPKPCFIMGSGHIPFKPNPQVTCNNDGIRVIPPIPELTFKGINYSAIHFRPNIVTTPVMSAFEIFVINSRNKVPEQIEFLSNSRELYISMDIAVRSLGNQLPRAAEHLRNHRMVTKVLDFQLARLKGRIAEIDKALSEMLKYCANCSVKERFDIIMRAAESGIIVDRFLDDLDRVRCLTKAQCDEEKRQAEEERKAADKKKEDEKRKLGAR